MKRITPLEAIELLLKENSELSIFNVTDSADHVFASHNGINFYEGDNTDIIVEDDTLFLIDGDGEEHEFSLK